ncbi:hypothetical protein DP113_29730 [Brasilonema octagenarum UFV-E1]|uniref:Uncharacterized protein n=2 Tax=Brasilonema TaxID=383614 RepID=A0A856MJE1_9CYAN|nr:hypothetical protein [Brasilonema octagenarum UFV-OR1]QDL11495.1 hypothetical protein DP114_29570 [Brasilonema sennae CENA114]QDL17878.1 hypothetical protein DP113_29730 [Brasilonema octagenarum UFV-E1]
MQSLQRVLCHQCDMRKRKRTPRGRTRTQSFGTRFPRI